MDPTVSADPSTHSVKNVHLIVSQWCQFFFHFPHLSRVSAKTMADDRAVTSWTDHPMGSAVWLALATSPTSPSCFAQQDLRCPSAGKRLRAGLAKSWRSCRRYFANRLRAIHNFFTCRISTHGRCHDLPRLNEFSGVVLSCFTLSRQTGWTEVLLSWTGRLAQTTVRGSCLFKVKGREKCEY